MPELPPSKIRPTVPPPGETSAAVSAPPIASAAPLPAYAELHCRTNFSFLEGASHGEELAQRAAELGYAALAVTDRNSLAGVVRAHVAAKAAGVKLLIGAEITPLDTPPVVLLATDRASYGRLSRLITTGRRRVEKGECELTFADIADHAAGLLALLVLPQAGPDPLATTATLARFRDLFGDRCYALAELHRGPDDERLLAQWQLIARQSGVPLVAANDVHYHTPERQPLQDVLTAIRAGLTVSAAADAGLLFPNAERALKSPRQMFELFAAAPELVEQTVAIANRCHFSLDELRYEYPEELCPPGVTPREHLTRLTWAGAHDRYPHGIPDKVRALIEHELELIADLRYEAYFLTVWDLVRFARGQGILCQGRGSAANSVVCFCLGVTSVDPERIDVLFERFVSRERNEAPDIDVDFEHERREEVLQYVYDKYGRERAGMTAEVISYRPRSAVRDVGKALGLSLDRVDRLAKNLDGYDAADRLAEGCREAGLKPESPVAQRLVQLVEQLLGFPRHLSQHVGGMVITHGPLCELVPIENAAMAGRTVIQWDKDDLDSLGMLKVDCLALGMLTAIHRGFDFLERHFGRQPTLANIPAEDPAVYEMISRADTMGVFQIESRAQMSMLPRLQPRRFYDLVIEVAIVRPGPIQGNMVHPYLRRRAGLEPVQFPSEEVRDVLQKTLGVPIFQEQAMRLAVVAAGFTPGEADQLRRAMGAWRRTGVMEQFGQKLIAGMLGNGYTEEFAQAVYQQIRGFGQYGFPESHAASFALLVYVSAWLKYYYPTVFAAALLNSQPMGFYAPAQLVRNLREHGGTVLPVDVNHSDWDCALEPGAVAPSDRETADAHPHRQDRDWALRLGFRMLRGLPQSVAETIVAARGDRPFHSLHDFTHRTGLGAAVLSRLAQADAFASLAMERRPALWAVLARERQLGLFQDTADDEERDEQQQTAPLLPPMPLEQQVTTDYRTTGLSLRAHPLSFLRPLLDQQRVTKAADLAHLAPGRFLRVAGLVLVRQRPSTARGIIFVTLEDETGVANLIIRPEIWERYRRVARHAVALLVHGTLERHGDVIHVMTGRLEDLSGLIEQLHSQSRDFH